MADRNWLNAEQVFYDAVKAASEADHDEIVVGIPSSSCSGTFCLVCCCCGCCCGELQSQGAAAGKWPQEKVCHFISFTNFNFKTNFNIFYSILQTSK